MWNDLTMQQRADVISMAVKAGLRNLNSIRSFYDETLRSRRVEDGEHLYAGGGKERKKGRYWIDNSSILPEFIVTPSGTDYVRDEAGNPAITVGALREINPNIPIYERNSRELKNNQYNTELPQWMVDQNADNYANAVSPGIGDFIDAGLKPFDAVMPSRWVGVMDSDNNKGLLHLFADDNRGFYINNNPKGAFNKSFHDTFPLAASIGNMAGDAFTLPLLNKGINLTGTAGRKVVNVAKPVIDKTVTTLQNNYPALFDPYTSWDATLGYHGDNIFSRALGTVGRRYGLSPKAGVPEFHRRLNINRPSQLKLDEKGNMIISSGRTGEGHDGIVNFATSEPARGHSSHKSLSGIDDYIVDSKAIGNQDFKSIQPSDTFFETGQLAINPKSMTLVSGNTEMLNYARTLGMRTLSSPRLRQLTASRMTKEDVINSRSEGIAKFLQNVREIKYGKGQQNAGQIGEEMQRLTSMRGTPTMQDYSYFEGLTGLNSGVRPAEMWNGTKEQGLELFGNWGRPRRTPTFNHVAYAPASNIESIYREAKMGIRPWEDYYTALENMPSARQQLGLNSAMDTYLGEATVPENFLTIKPQVRTRIGDVEIDNPNLLYHLDRGNGAGAFSNQGAYVRDGILFPGIAKKEGQLGYSWWNEGKPYATSVGGQPMTRLMTATKDTSGMLHVKSQNYPIGQWNGKRGFVLDSEYVNPQGVNVSGSTYTLDPNYGWRKVFENTPTIEWAKIKKLSKYGKSKIH